MRKIIYDKKIFEFKKIVDKLNDKDALYMYKDQLLKFIAKLNELTK